MYQLDEQEKLIVRELIRDPRISDNQIAIRTNVPLKTTNRKRKLLEENNLINYFCYLNNTPKGTGTFTGRSMFIIMLKEGITRKAVLERFEQSEKAARFFPKHLVSTQIGEYMGNIALIMVIESHKREDLIEIYNAELINELHAHFGHGCVKETITIPISDTLRIARNYLPKRNMRAGKIKTDWPDSHIYVYD